MTLGVFLAVLGAAFLHALWNALIKVGTSKVGGMVILSIVEVPIGLAVVMLTPAIDPAAVPWVIAAGCTHFAYKFLLTYAYDRGDLSRVYPIARGAAPMIVALFGAAFLADPVTHQEYIGIAVVPAGILLMARGVFTSGEVSRTMGPFNSLAKAVSYQFSLRIRYWPRLRPSALPKASSGANRRVLPAACVGGFT